MKSSITQIERHFDISSTHVGLIDGSFEMGNIYLLICVLMVSGKSSDSLLLSFGRQATCCFWLWSATLGPSCTDPGSFPGAVWSWLWGPSSPVWLTSSWDGKRQKTCDFTDSRTAERNWLSLCFCGAVTSMEPWARVSRMTPLTTQPVWKELCPTWTRRGLRTETLVRVCSFRLDQKMTKDNLKGIRRRRRGGHHTLLILIKGESLFYTLLHTSSQVSSDWLFQKSSLQFLCGHLRTAGFVHLLSGCN